MWYPLQVERDGCLWWVMGAFAVQQDKRGGKLWCWREKAGCLERGGRGRYDSCGGVGSGAVKDGMCGTRVVQRWCRVVLKPWPSSRAKEQENVKDRHQSSNRLISKYNVCIAGLVSTISTAHYAAWIYQMFGVVDFGCTEMTFSRISAWRMGHNLMPGSAGSRSGR